MTDNICYWFAASDRLPHGDNRKIIIGKTHRLRGEIVLCKHALHFCRDAFGALQFAPGPYLYQVRVGGTIVEDREKGGASARTYLAMRDATDMLRAFARAEALTVAHLWDMPDVVRRYLETGDETIRAAAGAAARAAREAAGAAARDAAWAAAWAAAWDAARAAREAAGAAARDAAWAAAREAARDAAREAAWAAAWNAAWNAAQDAARDAAWDASRERFNAEVAKLFATE